MWKQKFKESKDLRATEGLHIGGCLLHVLESLDSLDSLDSPSEIAMFVLLNINSYWTRHSELQLCVNS